MQVSDQIIAVLDALSEKMGVAIDWTSDNILPYLQTLGDKYIRYEIATSIIWMVIPFVLMVIAFALAYFCRKDEDMLFMFACAGFIILILFIIISIQQILDIVTCNTFPEKMIFQYIKTLLR